MLKRNIIIVMTLIIIIAIGLATYFFLQEKGIIGNYLKFTQDRVRTEVDLQPKAQKKAHYVGSQKCAECHSKEHKMSLHSMHSKMIQDVKKDPTVIVANFDKLPTDANFKLEDIRYTIGSKFKQRYMIRKDFKGKEDYVIGNYQWNSELKKWQAYKLQKSWYGKAFKGTNSDMPTSLTCDGCHFVGFMSGSKRVEPAIKCESCHGAGSEHIKAPETAMYKTTAADPQRSNEVCLQCHMRNRDKRMESQTLNELFEQVKDYPAGYEPGKPLKDYKLPAPFHAGFESKVFWGNGAAKKNRTQGNEFVRSTMYKHGVTCVSCHNPHLASNTAEKPDGDKSCMTCHAFGASIGPHQSSLEAHTRHKADSKGSSCIECHMPKVAKHTGKSPLTVRTHLFAFIFPDETRKHGVPNACNSCHKDKDLDWSEKQLDDWGMMSWEKK